MENIVLNDRVLIIDAGYGGGIKQATIYLYDYMRYNGFDCKIISLDDYNNTPDIFSALYNIYKNFSPKLVISHEYKHISVLSNLKYLFQDVITCFFSLPIVDIEDKNSERAIDFIISPDFNRVNNKRRKEIPWMFDFPKRFYDSYNFKKEKSKNLLYVGRIIEEKYSSNFIEKINRENIKSDLYGEIGNEKFEYLNLINSSKSINVKGYFSNYNIEKLYSQYEIFVLPSKTDCFSLFSIEAILSGCYPIIMVDDYRKRYPWMNINFPAFKNEDDMIYGIKEFFRLSPKAKIQAQKELRDPLVEYLKDMSDISKINDIMRLDGKEISHFKNLSLEKTISWGNKY